MKYVIMHGGKVGGVARYRAFNPAWALQERGHDIQYITLTEPITKESIEADVEQWYEILKDADFVQLVSPQKLAHVEALLKLRDVINETRIHPALLRIIADYDDYLLDVSPYNPAYVDLGTREVLHPDGYHVWKDKMDYNDGKRFDIERNTKRLEEIKEIMTRVDLLTTTNDFLAAKLRTHNFRVQVIPNYLETNLYTVGDRIPEDPDKIRILYAGGSSHVMDFHMVKPVIAKLMKKYPNLYLTFMGERYGIGRDIPLSRVETIPFTSDYREYVANLLTCQASIGICPLQRTEFNACKSPIKWEEYSAVGIPSVVSNTVYGEPAAGYSIVASTPEEWEKGIEALINEPIERVSLGLAARDHVLSVYSLQELGIKYESMLNLAKFDKLIIGGSL